MILTLSGSRTLLNVYRLHTDSFTIKRKQQDWLTKHVDKNTSTHREFHNTMSKKSMSKTAEGHHFPCPNPNCNSKVFVSEANRNKHFGAKPVCLEYARQVCAQMMLKQQAALTDQKLYTDTGVNYNHQAGEIVLPREFPYTNEVEDIDFPLGDITRHMADYEDSAFLNPEYDQLDLPGYQTTYTKSQQVEVCLLKCTEMETPLYAFEEIMKWTRHAFIQGYKFMPRQSTYRTQIDKLETWMGMENQRPEEVPVELPGIHGAIDIIKVTRLTSLHNYDHCWMIPY